MTDHNAYGSPGAGNDGPDEVSAREVTPPKVIPCYEFASANSDSVLDRVPVSLKYGQLSDAGVGAVQLHLLPQPRIQVSLAVEESDTERIYERFIFGVKPHAHDAQLAMWAQNLEGFASIRMGSDAKSCVLSWRPRTEPVQAKGSDDTRMVRMVFHVFNFIDFCGDAQTTEAGENNGMYSVQRLTLDGHELRVHLRSLIETSDTIEALRSTGGYGFTHVAELTNPSGEDFSGKQADNFLLLIRYFLSFVRGMQVAPVCPVGFNHEGERVWTRWDAPYDAWHHVETWFDPSQFDQMKELFPLFESLWKKPGWQETLREALYWYLNANNDRRGIDAGIILAQSALERIAYQYVVCERGLFESKRFRGLRTSDKLRKFLASLDIPLGIPHSLEHLRHLANQPDIEWEDLPHALTEFRNSLVHPERKNHEAFSTAHVDAWRAWLWLIELAILRLCGYRGTYSNRLTRRRLSEVEPVPWTATPAHAPQEVAP